MKLIFTLMLLIWIQEALQSQQYSEIVYQAGASIEVQIGADVCADNIIVNSNYTGWGTFCSSALPVTLIEFTHSVSGNNVTLKWKTESELNNSGFDVERKAAADSTWKKITFITGNGTTNELHEYLYEDKKLQTGKYNYRLKQIDYNGNFEYFNLAAEVEIKKPAEFSLGQSYPNPSNPKSNIEFKIPERSHVNISVYNLLGELVSELVNETKDAGIYTVEFNGSNLASGTYLYRIKSGNFTAVKKIILVK